MLNEDLIQGAAGAATYVGVPRRVIYHLAEKGIIPHKKLGRRLYFLRSELDAAFRSNSPAPAN